MSQSFSFNEIFAYGDAFIELNFISMVYESSFHSPGEFYQFVSEEYLVVKSGREYHGFGEEFRI